MNNFWVLKWMHPGRWPVAGVALMVAAVLPLGGQRLSAATELGRADIPQFDVFAGYGGTTIEANWFPVVCEIRNEGPTFNAVFEFSEGNMGSDFVRRMPIELPTGTLKRFSFPMYSAGRFGVEYRAVLRDQQGRVIVENNGIKANQHIKWNSKFLGAIPASAAGMPLFPEVGDNRNPMSAAVALAGRIQTEMMPDNPLALAGMESLYLNSQRAVDFEEKQVEALLSWLYGGGHLIIGVDAVVDVTGVPWLRGLMPGPLGSLHTFKVGDSMDQWLGDFAKTPDGRAREENAPYRNLRADEKFNEANIRVIGIAPGNATVELAIGGRPALVSTARDRGRVTVLLFNPELEPIRSWDLRPWFWARLTEIPGSMLTENRNSSGSTSVDGVFGAIVDSTQIRKLPVSALLFLLVVYLLVIGPLDQWWLKKINRQMLTWITFPCYVVLFSVLIYYIGYRLRAGDSEWNELQIVDVLPKGSGAELHGTTYASIYSPVNASYPIAGKERFASLRSESTGGMAGGGKAQITMNADNFQASVTVPVWTSQMFINAWQEDAPLDFDASLAREGSNLKVTLNNYNLPSDCTARLFANGKVYNLEFPAQGAGPMESVHTDTRQDIRSFVAAASGQFDDAINQRRNALGSDSARFLINPVDAAMALSLGDFHGNSVDPYNRYQSRFMFPSNLDLSYLMDRGQALLLVYCPNFAPTRAMNDFKPVRSTRNSLLRRSLPLPQ
jgi:hypothetical protein